MASEADAGFRAAGEEEMRRSGLPKQLEDETETALRAIFLKYLGMKKSHLCRDRIVGIMDVAFQSAIKMEKPK